MKISLARSLVVIVVFACVFVTTLPVRAGEFCSKQIENMPSGLGICISRSAAIGGDQVDVDVSSLLKARLPSSYSDCAAAFRCVATMGDAFCGAVATVSGASVGQYACTEDRSKCADEPVTDTSGLGSVGACPSSKQYCCRVADASPTAGVSASNETSESSNAQTSINIPDPLGGVSIPVLIGNIIKVVTGVIGSIALVIFVWGGLEFIYSGGDPGKVKGARSRMINGALGILMIYGAYFLTSTIINLILVTRE